MIKIWFDFFFLLFFINKKKKLNLDDYYPAARSQEVKFACIRFQLTNNFLYLVHLSCAVDDYHHCFIVDVFPMLEEKITLDIAILWDVYKIALIYCKFIVFPFDLKYWKSWESLLRKICVLFEILKI